MSCTKSPDGTMDLRTPEEIMRDIFGPKLDLDVGPAPVRHAHSGQEIMAAQRAHRAARKAARAVR